MNRISRIGIAFCLALACASITGCSSLGWPFSNQLITSTELAPAADRIAVYETSPPGRQPYHLVKRVWTESWKSAIKAPRYASAEAGAAGLRNQALALGGDAIMNFTCYGDGRAQASMICNGNVVKYAP